jgi:diaminopimelate epimerase
MSSVAVTKLHGTFNDFVVLDRREPEQPNIEDLSAFARNVCDRRGGVGADGVLVLLPSELAYARMRVINADGSEAEMCGNGMRCAIRYLSERGEGDHFEIETLGGIIVADVLEKDEAYEIRLNLGVPSFEERQLPFPMAAFVRMGNPHVVIFDTSLDAIDITEVGRRMSDVNVHVAVPVNQHRIDVRHFERGVGPTYACGTGAASAAAAAIKFGLAESPVDVYVPGGRLRVEWDGVNEAYLTGPAVRVFEAQVEDVRAVPV